MAKLITPADFDRIAFLTFEQLHFAAQVSGQYMAHALGPNCLEAQLSYSPNRELSLTFRFPGAVHNFDAFEVLFVSECPLEELVGLDYLTVEDAATAAQALTRLVSLLHRYAGEFLIGRASARDSVTEFSEHESDLLTGWASGTLEQVRGEPRVRIRRVGSMDSFYGTYEIQFRQVGSTQLLSVTTDQPIPVLAAVLARFEVRPLISLADAGAGDWVEA